MTRKVKGLRLTPGQYFGLIPIFLSVPVLIFALVTKHFDYIVSAVLLTFFGFIFRAYGILGDERMTYKGARISAKYFSYNFR